MHMVDLHIHWLAVIVATVAGFLIGGVWFSPRFLGKPWLQGLGRTQEQVRQGGGPGLGLLYAVVVAFATAFVLSQFVPGGSTIRHAIKVGGLLWFGLSMTTHALDSIFVLGALGIPGAGRRTVFLINTSHRLVEILVMSIIIAVWK